MPPSKRYPSGAKESAAKVIAREMPEWKIVPEDAEPDSAVDEEAMKTDRGPSIARLRQKFGVADAQPAGESDLAPVDDSVKTVRIEPKKGGPAKTADIKGGKVTIVQG